MTAIVAIVRANLRRMVNDRSNAFFIVVLPLLIVFALGSAVGSSGGVTLVGVADPNPTEASVAVVDAMAALEGVEIRRYETVAELRDDVARRVIDVGWAATQSGTPLVLSWYSSAGQGQLLRGTLENAVRGADVDDRVISIVAADTDQDRADVAGVVAEAGSALVATQVSVTTIGDTADDPSNLMAVLAAGQLTLFIFLTSMTGAGYLVLTRQYGVTRRMRAGPVSVLSIILGEGLSRYVVALVQGAIVIIGSAVLFGVVWRDLWAVVAVSAAMALVGSAAAMLLGTLAGNEQQAGAVALLLALSLAAFGGSMQPLQFFPDALRTAAFVTPHAWMNDSLWSILVDGEGLAEIWPSVVVLVGVGVALASLASVAMARRLR